MQAFVKEVIPYQEFFQKMPDVSRLEGFGMRCWAMVPDQQHEKLDLTVEEHIFTSVSKNAKAWRYYNMMSKWVQLSCNITFDESDTRLYPIPDNEGDEWLCSRGRTRQASHSI